MIGLPHAQPSTCWLARGMGSIDRPTCAVPGAYLWSNSRAEARASKALSLCP